MAVLVYRNNRSNPVAEGNATAQTPRVNPPRAQARRSRATMAAAVDAFESEPPEADRTNQKQERAGRRSLDLAKREMREMRRERAFEGDHDE